MARSRRSYRRTTSQRAVGLLAYVLPAPLQRIADTPFGSALLLLGIPALIVTGVLNLNWDGITPHLTIDRNRAAELKAAARDELGKIGNPALIQQWERSAGDLWNTAHGNGQAAFNGPSNAYGSPSNNAGNPTAFPSSGNSAAWGTTPQSQPIPASSAPGSTSTATHSQGTSPYNAYTNSPNYYQQAPSPPPQHAFPQQPSYQQPPQQQSYNQPQPYYQPPPMSYSQPQQHQSYQQPNQGLWRQ